MIKLRNRLMKWVNALATYPNIYGLMAFVFRVTLSPYFFWKNSKEVRQFNTAFRAHQKAGKKVVVVGLDKPANFNFFGGLVGLMEGDERIALHYANLAPELPNSALSKVTGTKNLIPFGVLAFLSVDLFLTAKSTLFWNRPKKGFLVHTFHSPVSLHQVYAEGSFQGFDVFFSNGPHQTAELKTYMARRKQPYYQVFEVGSEVIDGYFQKRLPFQKLEKLVYGPSWGPTSSLRVFGNQLIAEVLETGVQLTFRPHPVSLMHDKFWVDAAIEAFSNHPNFTYYDIAKGGGIPADTDGLISDWSGVAFEFALGFEKPVFFIDTPQKILNQNWATYHPNPGVEVTYRQRIGKLAHSPEELAGHIKATMQQPEKFQKIAREAYQNLVYNRGEAAKFGYEAVLKLLGI